MRECRRGTCPPGVATPFRMESVFVGRNRGAAADFGRSLLVADAVHGAAGGFPGVVRGARPERRLVLNDSWVAPDLFRALGVPEQVGVVALFPDENEMGGRHKVRHEHAPRRGTGKRVGGHAKPSGMVGVNVVRPELLLLDELRLLDVYTRAQALSAHSTRMTVPSGSSSTKWSASPLR